MFFAGVIAGDRPPRYGEKKRVVYRRARACPSPCLGRGNGWLACGFRAGRRSRGTGPRATGQEGILFAMRRSGSGEPELRSLGHAGDRGGQAPALRTHLANLVNPANPAHILLIVIIV